MEKKMTKTKTKKPKIECGMNSLGMPMFDCNCKNKETDSLGRDYSICNKCMNKIMAKLEKLMK
jgi:hypothetical protein